VRTAHTPPRMTGRIRPPPGPRDGGARAVRALAAADRRRSPRLSTASQDRCRGHRGCRIPPAPRAASPAFPRRRRAPSRIPPPWNQSTRVAQPASLPPATAREPERRPPSARSISTSRETIVGRASARRQGGDRRRASSRVGPIRAATRRTSRGPCRGGRDRARRVCLGSSLRAERIRGNLRGLARDLEFGGRAPAQRPAKPPFELDERHEHDPPAPHVTNRSGWPRERLLGAKAVGRASVAWVRLPPPLPNLANRASGRDVGPTTSATSPERRNHA
jgi:hypothetical protein